MSQGQKQAGVVLAVFAVVAGALFLYNRDKDTGDISCSLSAAALASLTTATRSGESTGAILAAAGLPLVCKAFVNALVEEPSREVKAEVQLPSGEVETFEEPGSEIIEPPTEPEAGPDVSRLIECVRWDNELLFRLCSEGKLEPPF